MSTHYRATPLIPRDYPSLANFADEYIFVIAGRKPRTYYCYTSVDMYTIGTNTWSQAPPLNKPRTFHSSCVAGDTICVFGGERNDVFLNSIEMLKLDQLFSNDLTTSWEVIELA